MSFKKKIPVITLFGFSLFAIALLTPSAQGTDGKPGETPQRRRSLAERRSVQHHETGEFQFGGNASSPTVDADSPTVSIPEEEITEEEANRRREIFKSSPQAGTRSGGSFRGAMSFEEDEARALREAGDQTVAALLAAEKAAEAARKQSALEDGAGI